MVSFGGGAGAAAVYSRFHFDRVGCFAFAFRYFAYMHRIAFTETRLNARDNETLKIKYATVKCTYTYQTNKCKIG